jgi:hypothetical protein
VIRLDEDTADVLEGRRVVRRVASEGTVRLVREVVARRLPGRRIAAADADFAALDLDDRDLSDPAIVSRKASKRRAAVHRGSRRRP